MFRRRVAGMLRESVMTLYLAWGKFASNTMFDFELPQFKRDAEKL